MATSEKHFAPTTLGNKSARTILLVALFATLPLFIPRLGHNLSLKGQSYRELLPNVRELITFRQHSASAVTLPTTSNTTEQVAAPEPANEACIDQLIEDPDRAMDLFDAALTRTEARGPGAITRISHYGDSPITNDGITGTVRELLQEKFGDSGHGFILVDRPWDWYGHQAITFSSGGGWVSGSLMNPHTRDGEFGLGGVAFFADGPGMYARFEPAHAGATGKKFSHLEVYYLAQPGGGQFSVSVDDSQTQVISTDSEQTKSEFCEIKAPEPAAKSFALKTLAGNVRVFGAVLENDDAGVVYDSLGVNGAFAGLLATAMNEQHWTEQLQHRHPNLVILNYGTNESEYASAEQLQRYERDLHEVVRRVRTALPDTSILIVSPMDRGRRAPGGRVVTLPSIPKIVELQRRTALETRCAFLNLFAAMGGEGTMARWYQGRQHLVSGDLTHPTATGAQAVGSLIYMALMENYSRYTERMATVAQAKNQIRKS